MSKRKFYGPPYSDRHIRRLKLANKSLFFQEVHATFRQNSNVVDADSKETINNYSNISGTSSKEKEIIYANAILNSLVNTENSLESLKSINIRSFKEGVKSKNETSKSKVVSRVLEKVEEDGHTEKENRFENQIAFTDVVPKDFDDLILYLNGADDFDQDSDSDEDQYDDSDDTKTAVSCVNQKRNLEFVNNIRRWSIEHIHVIPHSAINSLLIVLRDYTEAPFPKTARSLLQTPRSTDVFPMGIGQYCHYGIESAVLTFIAKLEQKNIRVDCLELLVNIDGAPLAKSSEKGLWIISCSESILQNVEVVGIYYGEDKPSDSNVLLDKFVDELIKLIKEGIVHNGKKYTLKLHALICDVPAKAYVLKIKYHTGYWSCTKCQIKGEWCKKLCFPGECTTLRTDIGFQENQYVDDGLNDGYQQGRTLLCNIPGFKLVTNVVLDYMHLICLGVTLKLIELWTNGPNNVKLSDFQRTQISDRLVNLKNHMPNDFSRKPRQFKNVKRLWKAHELRQFLLYSGPVVLLDILNDDLYGNFLYLHVAITVLVNPLLCANSEYLDFANMLLQKFVADYTILYGRANVTYNIHNLLHLVADVKYYGPLDSFSAFRFENHIRKVKQLVRKGDRPLQQIARRLAEINSAKEYTVIESDESVGLQKNHRNGPVLLENNCDSQYQILRRKALYINCKDNKNNSVLLKDGTYVECVNFIQKKNGSALIVGKPLKIVKEFYSEPINSSNLSINIVDFKKDNLQLYPCEHVLAKLCKIPFKQFFVVFPMMHTYDSKE